MMDHKGTITTVENILYALRDTPKDLQVYLQLDGNQLMGIVEIAHILPKGSDAKGYVILVTG